jgi:transcriptional regulator of NAD metabolism
MKVTNLKKKYYFEYIPATKGYKLGKRRVSKDFSSLQSAMKDARKRQKKGKIVQANFMKKKNIISHQIISSLNTKGKMNSRRYS